MRQLIKIFMLLICLTIGTFSVYAELRGSLDYTIPIDYTKIDSSELILQAELHYVKAVKSKTLDEDMTAALNMYTILTNKEPNNILYALRLGKLYDVLGKDRLAKGNYYHALGINQNAPEPYSYLGDFYYDREQYRKALKFYTKACDRGNEYNNHTLSRIFDIQKKLGISKNINNKNSINAPINPSDVPKEIITGED